MKTLIVLPTYNEKDNIPTVIIKVLDHEVLDILIIDDNSEDGTAEIARHWAKNNERVNLIERPGKMGLGTAYITGFKWGLEHGYDCIMEMDSDLSHNPYDLPRFTSEIEAGADLVIGSRYIDGKISVVGWEFSRLLLSRFGNFYASFLLDAPFNDMTSGFRAYSNRALRTIALDSVRSEGYSFQIEMAYYVWASGLKTKEIPIVFTERAQGSSKMSKNIVHEAFILPWRLMLKKLIRPKTQDINTETPTKKEP